MQEITTQQLTTALDLAAAVGGAIVAAGPDGLLSGELYAMLMSRMNFDTYESLIRLLVRSRIIERRADHRLVAVRGV